MFYVDATIINITNEAWGVLLNIVELIILFIYSKNRAEGTNRAFHDMWMLILCNGVATFSDMCGGILGTMPVSPIWQMAANGVLFFFDDLFIVLLTLYVFDSIGEDADGKVWFKVVYVIYGVCIGMLFLTFINGKLFYVDAANVYHRGPLFVYNQVLGLVAALGDFVVVLMNRQKMNTIIRRSIYFYCSFPLLAIVVQLIFEGVAVFLVATTISLLVMLVGLVLHNSREMYRQEQELISQSFNAMVSQLQPHFLYNSITSIMGIEGNPPETKSALANFGKYLRSNLDVLRDSSPVPFTQELNHVEAYVSLEKLRFDDKLIVDYNIQATDFEVPVLCVQMMVENAIKHGLTKKKGKGRVTVSSRFFKDHYEVVVEDDGVGFDPKEKKDDGRSHVGLESTIKRVEHYGGKLEIDSDIGFGTRITIIIPKGE